MNLIPIQARADAAQILYDLLRERSEENDPHINISHRALPSWAEHLAFIESTPYRFWYLIEDAGHIVGYVSASFSNEIGIVLFARFRGVSYGRQAVAELIRRHRPLPAIPAVRAGRWLANINPRNERSIRMFSSLGFEQVQVTYAREGDAAQQQADSAKKRGKAVIGDEMRNGTPSQKCRYWAAQMSGFNPGRNGSELKELLLEVATLLDKA